MRSLRKCLFFFFKYLIDFFFFFGCPGFFFSVQQLSPAAASGDCSLVVVCGLLTEGAALVAEL